MQIAWSGSSRATSITKSQRPRAAASARIACERRRSSPSRLAIRRGVKPLFTSPRIRSWRGGSIMLSMTPANGESWRNEPPCGRLPPVTEEYATGSSSTRSASAWRLTTQKPSPSGVCEVGSCREHVLREALLEQVEIGQVEVHGGGLV